MEKQIKAIVFDLDGTLTDTVEVWRTTLNETLALAGVPAIERKVYVEKWWGMDGKNKIRLTTGINNKAKLDELYKYLVSRLIENMQETTLLHKVGETIMELRSKGLKLAVVSNSNMDVVETQMRVTGLGEHFEVFIADTEPKPSPEGINRACESLGVSKDEAVFVGDSSYDVRAGRNAGIRTIIVEKDIPDMSELLNILKTNE
ncbi:hypothetical protein CL614_01950 [archaeon]|nr:hypothetical protein [archaeon]|tara:strand:- start:1521 stop:2129 length:609 start_codon:yes stop_codon:yes gene_type:complete